MESTVYYSPRVSSPSKGQVCTASSQEDRMGIVVPRSWPMSHPIQYVNSNQSAYSGTGGFPRRNASLTGIHRPKIPRPLSMPSFQHLQVHAKALATLNSYCLDSEESISPTQRHFSSKSPSIPNSIHSESVSTPTPTCAPWISNVKAIKKIQSKIGRGMEDKGLDINLSALRFHSVHGENIQIFQGGSSVRRIPTLFPSYCKAIVFSDRAVKVNERICVKVIGASTEFVGGIRFGFTNQDPSTLRYSLPDRAIPELAKRQGFWAKALLGDHILKNEAILFYYVNNSGKVRYGINGKKVGTFLKYVDTRKPLWALLDVYGNTTAIELVDPKAHLNNSRKNLDDPNNRKFEEIDSVIGPSLDSLILTPSQTQQILPNNTITQLQEPTFNNLQIHPTCGRNVQLNKFRNVAWRNSNECGNAYVFTSRHLEIGETIVIQVHQSDESFDGSLAFGLTSADPDSVNPKTLPDDSYFLVDRPEYWIFKKDVVNNLQNRDELAFTLSSNGAVHVSKNGGSPTVIMYVDLTCPLYAFFDLYGSTYKIALLGSILPTLQRIPQSEAAMSTRSLRTTSVQPQSPTPTMPRSSNFVSSPARMSVKQSSTYSPVKALNIPLHDNDLSTPVCQPPQCQNGRSPVVSLAKMTQQVPRTPPQEKLNSKYHPIAELCRRSPQSNFEEKYDLLPQPFTPYNGKGNEKSDGESKNWSVDCVACCRRPVNSLFSPCGHLTMCYDCAYDYWNSRPGSCCPICRKQIVDVIPISKTS